MELKLLHSTQPGKKTFLGFTPGAGNSQVTMHGNKIVSFETERLRFIMNATDPLPIWWYDPQCDVPLSEELEALMDRVGPSQYLQAVLQHNQMDLNPVPQTEGECRRAARKCLRSLKDYEEEKFIQ